MKISFLPDMARQVSAVLRYAAVQKRLVNTVRNAGRLVLVHLVRRAGKALKTGQLQQLILVLIKHHLSALAPEDALRFLFRLDKETYSLEGSLAVSYGGGIHTKHRHTDYHGFFIQRINKGERVLDVGCGNGALSYDIAVRSGAEVVALDLIPENIIEASERFPHPKITYLVSDIMKDPLPGAFDVVVLSNVLEHLPDRTGLLTRITGTARPSRWLIRVPLFERDWRVPLRKELGVEWRLDPTHEIEYTRETFAEEMDRAGLEITHSETRWGEIWAEAAPGSKGNG